MVLIPHKTVGQNKVPTIGVGTLALHGDVLQEVVQTALNLGYRHFDTASIYKNEQDLGKALEAYPNRADLFLTSKLWLDDQGKGLVRPALLKTLKDLKTDYVDLYLIHRPKGSLSVDSWKELLLLKKEGFIKEIGVSNFSVENLKKLILQTGVKPAVNQIEYHVFFQDEELKTFCDQEGIILEAYAPLASSNIKKLVTNETLSQIAAKHQATPAQIALAWLLNEDFVILPRTSNTNRLEENLASLEVKLDAEDLEKIKELNTMTRVFGTHENTDL